MPFSADISTTMSPTLLQYTNNKVLAVQQTSVGRCETEVSIYEKISRIKQWHNVQQPITSSHAAAGVSPGYVETIRPSPKFIMPTIDPTVHL